MYNGKQKNIEIIKGLRIAALVSLALFSIQCILTGLIIPLASSGTSCGVGGCGGVSIINLAFGILAGYWFIKEYKKTQNYGLYNSSNWSDLQWTIVSGLFILSAFLGTFFWILAIGAVALSYFKPEIFMNWYRDITHKQFN